MRKVLIILAAILLLGTRGSYALNIYDLDMYYEIYPDAQN